MCFDFGSDLMGLFLLAHVIIRTENETNALEHVFINKNIGRNIYAIRPSHFINACVVKVLFEKNISHIYPTLDT